MNLFHTFAAHCILVLTKQFALYGREDVWYYSDSTSSTTCKTRGALYGESMHYKMHNKRQINIKQKFNLIIKYFKEI
jgi:hypothetical protein